MSGTDRPIRVLRIIGGLDPQFGGPSESSVNACLASQAVGVQNTFVFPKSTDARAAIQATRQRLLDAGVGVRSFPVALPRWRRSREWGISPRLAIWTVRHARDFDVIHLHGAWGLSQIAGLATARITLRPCVLTPHESLTGFDVTTSRSTIRATAKKALRQLYVRALSLIVFSSSNEANDSLSRTNATAISVIPHALAELLERPAKAARNGGSSATLAVGFLGRLHPKKNVDVLIRAVAQSSDDTRLLIGGDGPDEVRRALESVADEVGMADRVDWLGFVARGDRERFLDRIDILAMPSAYECFGMVAAEGLARGVPTIVSTNTGVADLIARHGAGVVATPTVHGFADAIGQLIDQPELRVEFGKRGRAAVEAELSMRAHGLAQLDAYRRLVSCTRR